MSKLKGLLALDGSKRTEKGLQTGIPVDSTESMPV
jgi:hypothetical protein